MSCVSSRGNWSTGFSSSDSIREIADRHGLSADVAESALSAYNRGEVEDIAPFPDTLATLDELALRNYRLCLVTTGRPETAAAKDTPPGPVRLFQRGGTAPSSFTTTGTTVKKTGRYFGRPADTTCRGGRILSVGGQAGFRDRSVPNGWALRTARPALRQTKKPAPSSSRGTPGPRIEPPVGPARIAALK